MLDENGAVFHGACNANSCFCGENYLNSMLLYCNHRKLHQVSPTKTCIRYMVDKILTVAGLLLVSSYFGYECFWLDIVQFAVGWSLDAH